MGAELGALSAANTCGTLGGHVPDVEHYKDFIGALLGVDDGNILFILLHYWY